MAQVSIPLIQGANSTNNVGDAFDSRTAQFNQERVQKEKQQDADFHTVVKYASEGLTNEAKYFAQQKGINVPEQVFQNADFAKGLSIAGDLYDDPQAAQKFTTAYVSTGGDLMSRYNAGLGAAGKPMSKDDRDLALYIKKLKAQQQYGAPAKEDNGAYEAYQKAYNAAISSGLMTEEQADAAAKRAVAQYESMKPKLSTPQIQSQNPYAGSGNPAINQSYENIPPVLMDAGGNMSAPQQGQGQLTPPPAPQAQQQTKTNIPQDYKIIGKTHDGFDLYQSPDGRQFYDDGKPETQSSTVQTTTTINDELSSPAMVQYNPQQQIPRSPIDRPVITQQNGINVLMPQSQVSDNSNRYGTTYQSISPNDSRGSAAIKMVDNLANVPSHLRVAGGVVGSGVQMGANAISRGLTGYLDNIDDVVGSGLNNIGNYVSSPVAGNLIKMIGTNGDTVYVYERDLPYAQSIGYQQSQ